MATAHDISTEALKASPPLAITIYAKIAGLSLNDWVAIATLFYIFLQCYFLIAKHLRERRERKVRDDDSDNIELGV